MKTIPCIALASLLLPASLSRGAGGDVPFPSALDAAAVVEDRLDDIYRNALVLGNGDLNALLYAQGGALHMRITKNDVWDARVDTSQDPPMAVFDVAKHTWKGGSSGPASYGRPYPVPRVCANLILGDTTPVSQAGGSVNWKARLDLRRAVAEVSSSGKPDAPVRVRVLAQRNVFLVEGERAATVTPEPAPYLPAADQGNAEGVKWIRQRMPADPDYPGMEVATAVGNKGGYTVVAVATSWETKDVVAGAVKLVRETLGGDAPALVREHEQEWSRFWAASGVELGDPDFQNWWYRMVYYLRCFSKPGVVPIGLWAGLPNDAPGWHSDYHMNYNNWQPFWAPFPINHPEMADPLVRYLKQMLPRLKWFAKTTYDCEGAFLTISLFPFEPDPSQCRTVNKRQCALVPWGYTIGMAGMAMHNLWLRQLYQPDRKYLDENIYPVLREVALFYVSFMEKCKRRADGKVILGPSYNPEHGEVGTDDNPFDIAFIRFTFDATIEAAKILGRDGDLVERIKRMRDLMPPYPTASDPNGKPVVVDWAGCKLGEVEEHNITVPVIPVFPGDQVTWFSPEEQKDLFRRTIAVTRHNHNNSNIMLNVARARLSMPEALTETRQWFKGKALPNGMFEWQAHGFFLSESAGVAALVSEFLAQSVGGIIRVLPCWPKDLPARFANLGAQGGFLVSAQQADGRVGRVEITATVGGTLRLLSPWPAITVRRGNAQPEALQPDARGVVTVEASSGEKLGFDEKR